MSYLVENRQLNRKSKAIFCLFAVFFEVDKNYFMFIQALLTKNNYYCLIILKKLN